MSEPTLSCHRCGADDVLWAVWTRGELAFWCGPCQEENRVPDLTPTEIMECALSFFWSTPPDEQTLTARGDLPIPPRPEYLAQMRANYRMGMDRWLAGLDADRRQRWVEAAVARYRDEVTRHRREDAA